MTDISLLLPENSVLEWIALDQLRCAPAVQGLAVWRALRGDRRFPSRHDLKPRLIAGILQHMSILKVIDGGEDFENRIVGDAIVRAHTVRIAKRRFSDIAWEAPGLAESLFRQFRKVLAAAEPIAFRERTGLDVTHVSFTEVEGVLLPLGDSDEAIDHIAFFGTCTLSVPPPRLRPTA